MLHSLSIFFFGAYTLISSIQDLERYVARTYDDGSPYVVVYLKPPSMDRVKEEVFFENGQLDYVGYYKNGVEHGTWTYYWENGQIKSEEYYVRGKEEGIMYDFDENGTKIKMFKYSKGVLIEEKEL